MSSNWILCGFKRAGKTTVGRKIAEALGYAFIDTDERIAPDCRAFYVAVGAAAFRQAEREAIASLRGVQRAIIATGGGAVLDADNVRLLKQLGKIVYFCIEKEELTRRILRPPLPAFFTEKNVEEQWEEMYRERSMRYEAVSDCIVYQEQELWELIGSEPSSKSPPGASRTAEPSALSSTAVPPV